MEGRLGVHCMEQWYVLFTNPRKEEAVSTTLAQQGLETYLPTVAPAKLRRGRRQQLPFFPRYLFIHVDLAQAGVSLLKWCPGVASLVAFEGQPAAVPDAAIALIRERLSAAHGGPASPYRAGDRMRITCGPLKDLEAVFDKELGPSGRVRIMMEFLGRIRYCEVPVDALEAMHTAQRPRALPQL
ncbi:MAG: hypothetical protein GX605_13050 [Chloroflexi bacterium]|nr:hypothetical protein [Chloroflexota bacterium]